MQSHFSIGECRLYYRYVTLLEDLAYVFLSIYRYHLGTTIAAILRLEDISVSWTHMTFSFLPISVVVRVSCFCKPKIALIFRCCHMPIAPVDLSVIKSMKLSTTAIGSTRHGHFARESLGCWEHTAIWIISRSYEFILPIAAAHALNIAYFPRAATVVRKNNILQFYREP